MSEKPEILVVGTGAVGSFYGGKLAQAGARVSTLCRSDYRVVREKGIRIQSVDGDFTFEPEQVVQDAGSYRGVPEYCIVTVKVLPDIDVSGLIKDAVSPETAIVLLQNGIDIEPAVAEAFPDNEIISGLAFVCVNRTGYGEVSHLDYGRLIIGNYPNGSSKKTEALAELFKTSGIECNTAAEIVTARWIKLLWNAPFNSVSVLAGGFNTRQMIDSEKSLRLVRAVMAEVQMLAEKAGHPIPSEIIEKMITDTRLMEPYKTSMLLDYEAGRPMEVEAILGNALRIAERCEVAVPHIESMYCLLSVVNDNRMHSSSLPEEG